MKKYVNSIFIIFTILVLVLGSGLATSTAAAQEEADNSTIVQPFQGSGELAEGSAAVAGAGTTALPIESASPESVIGADGRVKVTTTTTYPSRAIAYLLVTWPGGSQGSCTGWYMGPRAVATAAHCIYNRAAGAAHGYATSIVVYPGRNGAYLPYGSTTMHKRWVGPGWTTASAAASPAYDYGVIQTNAALGNTVGWFGYHWQASNSFPGLFSVRGYPGDKPTGTMWSMNGGVTAVSANRLWYSIDTFGGQSGSPLYQTINSVCCYGFGVHTYGTSVSPYFGNSATRITQTVFNNITAWRNAAYP